MLVALTLLFVVLSPGVLLTLPPVGSKILMSGKTSLVAVLVHAVVFFVVAKYVLPTVTEGFSNAYFGGEGVDKMPASIYNSAAFKALPAAMQANLRKNDGGKSSLYGAKCISSGNKLGTIPAGAKCGCNGDCRSGWCSSIYSMCY